MLNPVFISAPFVYFPLSFRVLIFFIFFSAVFLLSFERQVNFFNVHFSHATFVRLRHLLTFNHDTFPHFLFVFFCYLLLFCTFFSRFCLCGYFWCYSCHLICFLCAIFRYGWKMLKREGVCGSKRNEHDWEQNENVNIMAIGDKNQARIFIAKFILNGCLFIWNTYTCPYSAQAPCTQIWWDADVF